MFCYPPYVSLYWPSPLQLHVTSIPVANHALLLRNLSHRAELQLITVIKLSLFDCKLNNHQWLLLECELGIFQILSRTPKDDAVKLVIYSHRHIISYHMPMTMPMTMTMAGVRSLM